MEEEQKNDQEKVVIPTGNNFSPDKPEPKPDIDSGKSFNKIWLLLAIVIFILASGITAYFVFLRDKSATNTSDQSTEQSQQAEEEQSDPNTIRMLATGDFIAHDSVNEQAKTGESYDYLQFMTAWQPFFDKTDISFCNHATPAGGGQFGISGYPVFNAPLEWIGDMNKLGCNLINTGTNHTNDKGQRVITAQAEEWDTKETLAVAGSNRSAEEQQAVRYFDVKGIKFAFVSYSTYTNIANPNSYSLNMFTPGLYQPQMEEANEKADIVIVSMRWGTEYSPEVNAQQDTIAQTLSNLGADIILGHGPHVLEPVKKLTGSNGNETIVWFSLGNFLNTQIETEALTGCVAALEIDVPSKTVKSNKCLPFYMHYEWTAEQAAAQDLLSRTNLQIVPLDTASELITKSQLGTTVEEQTERISSILNKYADVPILSSLDY